MAFQSSPRVEVEAPISTSILSPASMKVWRRRNEGTGPLLHAGAGAAKTKALAQAGTKILAGACWAKAVVPKGPADSSLPSSLAGNLQTNEPRPGGTPEIYGPAAPLVWTDKRALDLPLERHRRLQIQLHVQRPRNRVGAIGFNLGESEAAIQRHGVGHDWLDGVESHFPVSDCPSFGDQGFRQRAPCASTAKLWTKIEALHLANSRFQFVQRHTACQCAAIFRDQQPAFRRRIISRKAGKFLIETLKAQAEAERVCILEEKLACLSDLGRRLRLVESESGISHAIVTCKVV